MISVTTHRHAWRPLLDFMAHALWETLVYVDQSQLAAAIIVGMTRGHVVLELLGCRGDADRRVLQDDWCC